MQILNAILCLILLSIVPSDSIEQIQAPNLAGKQKHFQPWARDAKQIQPRTDPASIHRDEKPVIERMINMKGLFLPGFGVFKNLLPTHLTKRPERDARY